MTPAFTYHDGHLQAEGVPLSEIAERFGTPLYVYHGPTVTRRVAEVRASFESLGVQLFYSVKANPNLHLLRHLAGLGLGFDIVSGGELARLQTIGADPDRIVFAGVGKTDQELRAALEAGVGLLTAESVQEVARIDRLAREAGRSSVDIGLRLNPDVDAGTHRHITTGRRQDKFGLLLEEYREVLTDPLWEGPLRLTGLHIHLGSQITTTDPYQRGLVFLRERLDEARKAGHTPGLLDLGGGFGIAYGEDAVPLAGEYAEALAPMLADLGIDAVIELGRYLVGPAGVLLTRIEYTKPRDGGCLLVVDAGMTDLLRPTLYEAWHRILPVAEPTGDERVVCDVAGPLCESSDFLGRERSLPPLGPGDLLAVLDAGAYGMSMAGGYNSRRRPAEVWVGEGGEVRLIRRRETMNDLLAPEREAEG
jgi:diaminopimelate decarboxylase